MSKEHTPGPWKFLSEVGRIEGRESGKSIVAYIAGRARKFGSDELGEAYANGTLIAAAPEMLVALREVHTELLGLAAYLETCAPDVIVDNLPTTIASLKHKQELIDAAIRKAKGES